MKHINWIWEFGCGGISFVAILAAVFSFAVISESADISSSIRKNGFLCTVDTEFGGFSIDVNPGSERITYLSLRLDQYRCGGITITGDIQAESRDIWPIVNNRFEIDTNLGIYQVVICGVFDDARREIRGSWRIHSAGTICSGEWKSDLPE